MGDVKKKNGRKNTTVGGDGKRGRYQGIKVEKREVRGNKRDCHKFAIRPHPSLIFRRFVCTRQSEVIIYTYNSLMPTVTIPMTAPPRFRTGFFLVEAVVGVVVVFTRGFRARGAFGGGGGAAAAFSASFASAWILVDLRVGSAGMADFLTGFRRLLSVLSDDDPEDPAELVSSLELLI